MAGFAMRSVRPLILLLLSFVATVGVLLAAQTVSFATPTAGELESQIDQKWEQIEPIIEKYNAVHDQLLAGQKQVAALEEQIKPLQIQVDLAMARVGAISNELYINGTASKVNAILTAGSPTNFVEQLTTLNQLAAAQAATVSDAKHLKGEFDAKKAPIDAQVAQLQQESDALKKQANDINAQIKQLDDLRLAAYGSTAVASKTNKSECMAAFTYDGSAGAKAARYACNQLGKKYVWGAAGPNTFDCSGLTMMAWDAAGVSLPHNARQQKQVTTRITKDQLKTGDLIFMYSDVHHVVIYIGNGWDVAAPTYGEPVQMQKPFDTPSRINSYGRPHS